MNHSILTFKKIAEVLLRVDNADIKKQTACTQLYDWFCSYSKNIEKFDSNHTYLNSGQALSVQEAGECILDYKRTVSFLQAIRAAIDDLNILLKKKPVEILYAGTGPFASLILPILHLYPFETISVTLLDIHEESIQNTRHLIKYLSYQKYVYEYLIGDATKISFSKNKKFDLIISETMNQSLIKEPQVSITKNLIPYLSDQGIFIPEKINISVACSHYCHEPNLTQNRNEYTLKNAISVDEKERTELKSLFSVSKETVHKLVARGNVYFKSEWIALPQDYSQNPDISLFTEVIAYKNIKLNNAHSLITNPYCIASIPNFPNKTHIKLIYQTNQWKYKLKRTLLSVLSNLFKTIKILISNFWKEKFLEGK